MVIQGRKPFLLGGLGLCLLLLAGEELQQQWGFVSSWGLWGLSFLGLVLWRLSRSPKKILEPVVTRLTHSSVQTAISITQTTLQQAIIAAPTLELSDLQTRLEALALESKLDTLEIIIAGEKRTGKSSLLSLLQNQSWSRETSLRWSEYCLALPDNSAETDQKVLENADLVLLVINGDLGDRLWHLLKFLHNQHVQLLLVFNKQDQYPAADQNEILHNLQHHVRDWLSPAEVMAISANPPAIKVRSHLADGSQEERLEPQPPAITVLITRLEEMLLQDQGQMSLARCWRECQQIQSLAKSRLNQQRRGQAHPLIEQYQWLAGGAALINPVASIDLLATFAINAQMIQELSAIYQQPLSVSQARQMATSLGKVLVKLGLVEFSSQAIATLLKSQPLPLTYLAGGLLQGISAAYLTRVAGLSLVRYYELQSLESQPSDRINVEQLKTVAKSIFAQTQRLDSLQAFVRDSLTQLQGIGDQDKLIPKS